jgi:DNA polymerase-3 subunit beta
MKVRCDKNELAECLGDILGIVPATQSVKPIFLDFHLKTENGHLVVEVTDLDLGARIRLARVEVLEEGELALPAARFYSIVREVPDKNIILESLSDGRGATLRADGYEFKMLGEDPREFPSVPAFAKTGVLTASREKFLEMLRRVAIAASRDMARFQLTGVFFEVEGEKLILTATDGKRLTNDHMTIENPSGIQARAIVPNRVVDVLLKVLAQGGEVFSFVMGDPNFQASFGRGELTGKVIQGTYPDYRVAIPHQINVRVTAKRNDFLSAARSAALMTDKQTATVVFRFEDGKACLNTQASDIGESKIEVPIALQGEPLEVRFNPTYFIDALRSLTDEEVRIEFFDAEKPGAVRGGQHYRHLVMPLVTSKS